MSAIRRELLNVKKKFAFRFKTLSLSIARVKCDSVWSSLSSDVAKSVRGILKRGARNFRKFEKSKGLNQKLFRPKSVGFFAQNWVKSKKKVFTQIWSEFSPKRGCKPKRNEQNIAFCVIKPYAQLAKGGHAAILHTILCNYTILATQRGLMAQWPPLNTPLDVAYNCKRYPLSLRLKECLGRFCIFMGIEFHTETP